MNIENENTLRKALADGINLFLGAGFSVLARDGKGASLPVGGQLADELRGAFSLTGTGGLMLPQLCAVLEAEQGAQLRAYFQERYTVGAYDPRYGALSNINVRKIFTTNIDDLILKIYATLDTHYVNDVTHRGATFGDRTAIDYVPLHGSVAHADGQFLFSTTDLATAFSEDPDKWHLLTGQLQALPTLFWGYSLSDPGTQEAISFFTSKGRSHREKWMCLRTADEGAARFFKALGFYIIVGDTGEMLDYLANFRRPSSVGPAMATTPTARLFPEYAIPPAGTVPVRPVSEFYLARHRHGTTSSPTPSTRLATTARS